MRQATRGVLSATFALLALAGTASAQGAGSITGTAKDSSGAALPGALATATDPAQSASQTVRTNPQGVFLLTNLPPGTYSLKVELAGFKTVETSNVILPVSSKVNAGNFVLEVGEVSETVTVEADAGRLQIQTESGERSDLVTNKQLRDVALNGRMVIDLLKTIPGVIASANRTTSTVTNLVDNVSINGTRGNQHEYTIDGVTNFNLGNNSGILVTVNPDALEEVKVLTSNYQAEYGRSGGGFIALTTRGGTREYRGGLRYFRRHDSLNANNFFNNARGGSDAGFPRPLYRFNYYGWDFGGPVPFVGSKENPKLFFFVAQEYYDQLVPQQSSVNIRVPTAAERAGNFSQTVDGSGRPVLIRDPLTGLPFPGNVIPADRIYAPGQAALNLFPAPNTTAGGFGYNFTSQQPSEYPRREDIVRLDWQAASTTRLSARFIYNKDEQKFAYGTTLAAWNWPLTDTIRRNGPGKTLSLTLTHIFNPTLSGEFVYGAGRGGVNISPADDKADRSTTGINTPLFFPNANVLGYVPMLRFDGIANIPAGSTNTGGGGFLGTGFVNVFGSGFDQRFVINNFMGSLTKAAGKHAFKAGAYYQRGLNASNSQVPVESAIDFSHVATNPLSSGQPWANALLGVYTNYSQGSTKINQNYFYQDLSVYLQDTWKVTPRLTLDLGIRLSYYEPFYNKGGSEAYFNQGLFNPAQATRLYRPVCVGASTCSSGQPAYRGIDPAVTAPPSTANTVASNFVGTLVPNSGSATNGLGLTENGYPQGGVEGQGILPQPRLGFSWDLTGDRKTVVRGGFGITYDRFQSITDGATNPPFVLQPSLVNGFLTGISANAAAAVAPSNAFSFQEDGKWPTIYSYSVGVQRDLGKGIVVDVAYVGTQSRHNLRRSNLNSVPYGATFTRAAQDPTRFAGGVIPAEEPGLPQAHRDAGLSFSGQFALPINFLRPFPGYADIPYLTFDGDTSYNSLQVGIQKRYAKGFTFGVAYTLSKAETTIGDSNTFTNVNDPAGYDYSLAPFDRTHVLVVNYVWNLPKGSNLLGGGRFARALLDNWTISGISWISSGNPAELTLAIAGQDAGNRMEGTYTAGNSSGQQPRFYVEGDPEGAPNEINTAAFRVPGINDLGPYARNYLRNPGFNNHDLSVFKNFPIGNSGKRSLQLRLEAFNVLNHTQFSGVNRTTNITNAAGQTGAAIFNNYNGLQVTNNTRPAGSPNVLGSFFGEYNTARDPRIVQLGIKLYF